MVNILPKHLHEALEGNLIPEAEWTNPIAMVVDLFQPLKVPTNAIWAAELRQFLTLEKIGTVLGISKRQAHLAAELGDKMVAAGLTDPYVRLTSAPKSASHWRTQESHSEPSSEEQKVAGDSADVQVRAQHGEDDVAA